MQVSASDIINTTPHDIVLYLDQERTYTIKKDTAHQLRMRTNAETPCGSVTVPSGESVQLIAAPAFVAIEGPVGELLGEAIVVSMPVGDFIRTNRANGFKETVVLGPDTGAGAMRDGTGRIIGTTRFIAY